MRVAKLFGPGDIRVTETDPESVDPGTVRVDVGYTGVCGSDVHEYNIGPVPIRGEDTDHEIPESEWDEFLPKPMGHEIAGTVSELGDGVDSVSVGDEVALNVLLACGECSYCEAGQPQLCTVFDGAAVNSPGFADSIVVPASAAVPVPESVPLRHAALAEPLSVSVHAVRQAGVGLGDSVAVFGAGPIGLGIVDAVTDGGARTVLVSEPDAARRAAAADLGADAVIDPTETDPVDRIDEATDGGADVSFEAAGVSETFTQSLRATKYGGTVAVVSVFEAHADVHPNDIVQAERNVVGSFAYDDEFPITLEMMADDRLQPERYITDEVPLDRVESAFDRLTDPERDDVKILVEP